MTVRQWLVVFMAVSASGCGGGLSQSEGLANFNPYTFAAARSKGDILIQEGLEYAREGYFEKFLASMREALIFYSADGEKSSDIYGYIGNAYLEKTNTTRHLITLTNLYPLQKSTDTIMESFWRPSALQIAIKKSAIQIKP